jgi:hypothetical protein
MVEIVAWQACKTLLPGNHLAHIRDLRYENAYIKAWIDAECAAYPGLTFYIAHLSHHELACALPHASEQWDAL